MSSDIEGIITTTDPAAGPELPAGTRAVPLSRPGLWFIPLTNPVTEALSTTPEDAELVAGFYYLTEGVARWARALSEQGPVLYVQGETWAGEGFQAAIGWDRGKVCYEADFTRDRDGEGEDWYEIVDRCDSAINTGLRSLGVTVEEGDHDEFDTAGLTLHRSTTGWLTS
ncbi:hypothetical protein [Actinoplanes sp. NPDC049118]|uniref:hypothetical protein n=1 Tax=Actinoplanes sp. NPDC049118 TaxID=3155769 RepID=UPI0033EC9C9D